MYLSLLLPLAAGLITQIAKLIIKSRREKIVWRDIMAYSGMPSSHSAIVIALATIIWLEEGLSSPLFALALVFTIVVIRDAVGLRRYLGQHGKVLNILVRDLKDDRVLDEHYPRLLERVGHTPAQVVVGSIIGFLVSLLGFWWLA